MTQPEHDPNESVTISGADFAIWQDELTALRDANDELTARNQVLETALRELGADPAYVSKLQAEVEILRGANSILDAYPELTESPFESIVAVQPTLRELPPLVWHSDEDGAYTSAPLEFKDTHL